MPEDVYIQFKGLEGECRDDQHAGKDGWVQIKSFSFGFGLEGKPSSGPKEVAVKGKNPEEALKAAHARISALEKNSHQEKTKQGWGKSGALKFEPFNFAKGADIMSKRLMEICHGGGQIPEVKVVMCRPGADKAQKTEFLALTFSDVYLKSCDLTLVSEELPSENINFEYSKVQLEATWTDNAMGTVRAEPVRAEWDLRKGADNEEEEPDP